MKMKSIKNGGRPLGIVAIVAMIGLAVTACDQSSDPAPSQWTVSLIQNHTSSDNTTVASFVHTNGGQFPANVATPAVRTGYEFTGFWTTRSGGTQYFSAYGVRMAAAGNPRTMDNDLRLYAQWHQGTTPPP
ncbi:MAG: InlB B-repeat-containing protein, partial [Treponema sp.]|nr:InlB B-repeat-containing protein [Treponema sp.]